LIPVTTGPDDVRIGISGWDYDGWRGDFYPAGLAQRDRLTFAALHFSTVEINGSFYALQRPSTYLRWREATPADFTFALKGSRYITHMLRLRDPTVGLANFFASGPLALGPKLGPVLWQFPASMRFDEDRLHRFFQTLPASMAEASELASHHTDHVTDPLVEAADNRPIRHAVEPRHDSFNDPRFYRLLEQYGISCAMSDSPTWPLFNRRTAAHAYIRLHGHSRLYASRYSDRTLDAWARRCRSWAADGPVYVYFDNDAEGHAPHDAMRLIERVGASTNSTPKAQT